MLKRPVDPAQDAVTKITAELFQQIYQINDSTSLLDLIDIEKRGEALLSELQEKKRHDEELWLLDSLNALKQHPNHYETIKKALAQFDELTSKRMIVRFFCFYSENEGFALAQQKTHLKKLKALHSFFCMIKAQIAQIIESKQPLFDPKKITQFQVLQLQLEDKIKDEIINELETHLDNQTLAIEKLSKPFVAEQKEMCTIEFAGAATPKFQAAVAKYNAQVTKHNSRFAASNHQIDKPAHANLSIEVKEHPLMINTIQSGIDRFDGRMNQFFPQGQSNFYLDNEIDVSLKKEMTQFQAIFTGNIAQLNAAIKEKNRALARLKDEKMIQQIRAEKAECIELKTVLKATLDHLQTQQELSHQLGDMDSRLAQMDALLANYEAFYQEVIKSSCPYRISSKDTEKEMDAKLRSHAHLVTQAEIKSKKMAEIEARFMKIKPAIDIKALSLPDNASFSGPLQKVYEQYQQKLNTLNDKEDQIHQAILGIGKHRPKYQKEKRSFFENKQSLIKKKAFTQVDGKIFEEIKNAILFENLHFAQIYGRHHLDKYEIDENTKKTPKQNIIETFREHVENSINLDQLLQTISPAYWKRQTTTERGTIDSLAQDKRNTLDVLCRNSKNRWFKLGIYQSKTHKLIHALEKDVENLLDQASKKIDADIHKMPKATHVIHKHSHSMFKKPIESKNTTITDSKKINIRVAPFPQIKPHLMTIG